MFLKDLPDAIPESEVSGIKVFLQGMLNRIGISHFKYGNMADSYPYKVNALDCLKERLRKYEQTGNTEWLMDVANFAMIEYMFPDHEQAHFRATDSDESPGLRMH